jgi:glycerol dehydrogenase
MKKAIIMPGKYIQGAGVLAELGAYVKMLGTKPAINWDKTTKKVVEGAVVSSLKEAGVLFLDHVYSGECTKEQADDLYNKAKKAGCDVIIGIGGGKSIDTAKAAAAKGKLPLLVVPTIASNDAPTSACTVWYNDEGECLGFDFWASNPNIVLVDTSIIVKAPVRYLIAGIGDALATWPEANAAYKSRAGSCAGGVPTLTAVNLAKLCFDLLLENALEAISAVQQKVVTPAVEKVVEATTLLSGIGWESGGLACAHAIANYLPVIHETHEFLHGEKVAFGLISQLCLEEDLSTAEIHQIVDFMIDVGLPVTFADLKMQNVSIDRIREFGKIAAASDSFIHNHNFKVTADSVSDAMIAANALGIRRKALKGIK